MQYRKEHHCPRIIDTSRSWDGIDGGYNGSCEGHILRQLVEREASTSLPIHPKSTERTGSLKEMKQGRSREVRLYRAGCEKAFHRIRPHMRSILSPVNDGAPRSHLASLQAFFMVISEKQSTTDIKGVEVRDPTAYDRLIMYRAAPFNKEISSSKRQQLKNPALE